MRFARKGYAVVDNEDAVEKIQGVKGFSPAEYASSVHGSQARILELLGEDITYDDLICLGGFAFRIGISKRMCPSAAHPCCGYVCLEGSNRAIPWHMDSYETLPWQDDREDEESFRGRVCDEIRRSIDAGVPVHYGSEEDGLIIGYSDGGRRWRCLHPYHEWGKEEFWHDEARGFAGGRWPWGIVIWKKRKAEEELESADELLEAALQQAVEMWTAGLLDDQYVTGEEAYRFWIDWLSGIDAGNVDDPKAGMQGNGWCLDVLLHSREAAARWLAEKALEMDADPGKCLTEAADHYRVLVRVLSEGLGCTWDLALPPDRFDEWTPELRADQIGRLRKAEESDSAAIAAIGRALDLMRMNRSDQLTSPR
jgi:hypothetical protein